MNSVTSAAASAAASAKAAAGFAPATAPQSTAVGEGETTGLLASAKAYVGIKPPPPPTWQDKVDGCCGLSRTQRWLGFAIMFSSGMVLTTWSTMSIGSILLGDPSKFAAPYALGNALSLSSMCFLAGPIKQFKSMSQENRKVSCAMYVVSLFTTLFFAFSNFTGSSVLCLLSVIVQFGAMLMYCSSYVPFLQPLVKRCLGNVPGALASCCR